MKESGIGREGSKYGIEDYLEIKYLCMGGIDRSLLGEERPGDNGSWLLAPRAQALGCRPE
jgi:hypothetical protein